MAFIMPTVGIIVDIDIDVKIDNNPRWDERKA